MLFVYNCNNLVILFNNPGNFIYILITQTWINGAKKVFKVEDLEAQTAGVECRKDASVIDEIPGAYKDIDQVMAAQTDLVDVVHTLKQVMCIKG